MLNTNLAKLYNYSRCYSYMITHKLVSTKSVANRIIPCTKHSMNMATNYIFTVCVYVMLVILSTHAIASVNKSTIVFGLTISSEVENNGLEGVQRALDEINKNTSSRLQNYTLTYTLSESQCDRTLALRSFFELKESTEILALIDAGCSTSTEATAEFSHIFNFSQISCSSSSPVLANRKQFPKYFQLLPSSSELAFAYAGIAKKFGWKHVVFFVQDEPVFTNQVKRVKELVIQQNVNYTENRFSTAGGISSLGAEPFNRSYTEKIFIIAANEKHAIVLLCEAYKKSIKQPTHVFITYQWYSPQWWVHTENTSCTPQQIEMVLNRSLALSYLNGGELSVNESDEENDRHSIYGYQVYKPYCYDATYFLAHALDLVLSENDDMVIQNRSILDGIFSTLSNHSFTSAGATGEVTFDENGIRKVDAMSAFQYRYSTHNIELNASNLELVVIGEFSRFSNFSFRYVDNESNKTVWNGSVPSDGLVPPARLTTLFLPITIVFSVLASIGIVFSIVCIIFNVMFRNKKVVRVTSPKLNYFIVGGAILFYIDVYFFVLPTTDPPIIRLTCNITTWLTVIAYTFCFGTIMAKMCRVWIIFRNPQPIMRKAVKDWMLIVAVLTLFGLDMMILTIYTAIEQTLDPESIVIMIPNLEIPAEEGQMYEMYICDSKVQDVAVGLYYGFKAILQIVALVLAFLTRKVKVKGLDDAKYIAMIIYVTSIIIGVLVVCEFALPAYINTYAVIFGTGILLVPTCVLGLVFIPTMIRLHRDPKGEKVFVVPRGTTVGNQQTIDTLRTRVKELEGMLGTTQSEDSPSESNMIRNKSPERCDVI